MMTADEQAYAFDNAIPAQLERLRTLEALFDPGTFRHLEALGVAEGWRCLEVGAGGGSVARWMSARVGAAGSVLATDLDPRFVAGADEPNLDVRSHDVLQDPLPRDEFDIVHVRMVLTWLPDAGAALARLVAALKPGGTLLAEEIDFGSVAPEPRLGAEAGELFVRALEAHNEMLAERSGFDPHYGRRILGDLEAAGLADAACEGRASMWRGGEPGGRIWELTLRQLRDPMIEAGVIAESDIDAAIALCAEGLSSLSPVLLAAWGRRI
jgi:SAM-dependent methyltransferase